MVVNSWPGCTLPPVDRLKVDQKAEDEESGARWIPEMKAVKMEKLLLSLPGCYQVAAAVPVEMKCLGLWTDG